MSAPQAAAITACTACAAVGGAAAGGAFSSSETSLNTDVQEEHNHETNEKQVDSPSTTVPSKTTPNWFPITDELEDNKTDFNTTGKIGKDYEKYLVGAFGGTDKSNTDWWNKSYEKYQADQAVSDGKRNFSDLFSSSKVSKGFKTKEEADATDPKPLNKVCLEVYKKQKTEIEFASGEDTNGTKAKLRDDLWRYCSPLGETPKTIESANEVSTYNGDSQNKIGKTKKDKLLSVTAQNNQKLWELKNTEFSNLNDITDTESKYFKHWQDKVKKKTDNATLKAACENAYKLTNSAEESDSQVKDTNVVKYCSLLGS